ncbi:MAG: hypothetical protein HC849_02040 [Oscillatoriales cyanobacterium RU_3_3]|nr:hypothetical protein [Microcoleus sp. SU_5_6]NJM59248.1 hypothetical protein [Oscillatoriales cyanobacterium RU_3_3]NJR21341.1 hypothetical protein [Richelia sp. CSU_2_1]
MVSAIALVLLFPIEKKRNLKKYTTLNSRSPITNYQLPITNYQFPINE